jgi:hypothetical protein
VIDAIDAIDALDAIFFISLLQHYSLLNAGILY